jgi:hypothetical protein
MAATLVGVIYSPRQRVIRRVIVPDNDAQLNDPAWLLAGERMLTLPLATYQAFQGRADLEANVAGQIGAAGSDRCVLLDGRNVVQGVVFADPTIDVADLLPKGWSLVENAAGEVGQKWNAANGTFT